MSDASHEAYKSEVRRLLLRWAVVLAVLTLSLIWAGWRMRTAANRLPESLAVANTLAAADGGAAPEAAIEHWTCTMHPDVRQPAPGQCPQCGMDLVPKYTGSDEPGVLPAQPKSVPAAPAAARPREWYRCTMPECNDHGSDDPKSRCPVCGMVREQVEVDDAGAAGSDREIVLSERARNLAGLATEPVEYRQLVKRIRTVGKITYDETRHKMVAAWTDGRIDQLFADFTGMVVARGDHLVKIYSPKLLSAQDELLQALRGLRSIGESALEPSRRSAEQLVASARRQLELLGVTAEQIEELQRTEQADTHLVIHAPLGGTVVRKTALEGMYVKTGDPLYEIADLTHVWLMLELYEADLPWIRPFQEVRLTADALPGEGFSGRIAFVDPVVDKMTRTIKVRVNVANPRRLLKPEMFVTAEIDIGVGADGRAAAPPVGGSYACPMHPWETADVLASCPVCLMSMVPVATIPGYSAPTAAVPVLTVPRQAILQTGKRALAYVEVEPGQYRGVEVLVGLPAYDPVGREFYPVLSGLEEGQQVVTRGNFVIDSQMQIAGKASLFHARGLQHGSAGHHGGQADQPSPSGQESGQQQHAAAAADDSAQTKCPVMGNPVNPEVFIEYRGTKVYFCCWGCDQKFKDDPEQYLSDLPAAMQESIRKASSADQERSDG